MVHPHMCGEFAEFVPDIPNVSGSSPHVWGILLVLQLQRVQLRFIPTCVGNSKTLIQHHTYETVHPHMCGEFIIDMKEEYGVNGSSPHVWGILICTHLFLMSIRFIPTCVGNSNAFNIATLVISVHPHMCGEFVYSSSVWNRSNGSSPHVWGILSIHHYMEHLQRFIPTCVGNSHQQIPST